MPEFELVFERSGVWRYVRNLEHLVPGRGAADQFQLRYVQVQLFRVAPVPCFVSFALNRSLCHQYLQLTGVLSRNPVLTSNSLSHHGRVITIPVKTRRISKSSISAMKSICFQFVSACCLFTRDRSDRVEKLPDNRRRTCPDAIVCEQVQTAFVDQ